MKRIHFKLLFLACIYFGNLKSQSLSSINVIDLDILPPHGAEVSLDAVSNIYRLTVKIEDISSVSDVYFALGERNSSGTILEVSATVVKENNKYFIVVGSERYLFTNYTILLPVSLTKEQFGDLKDISFYLKDKDGKVTTTLHAYIP